MSALIDSHAHLVAADMARYPPSPLKGRLDRTLQPFTAEDLLRHMDENSVERAVAVQRAHVYGFNNDYVVDAAAQYPDRLVAVGMIDSLDPKAPDLVRYWVQERGMVGIRLTEAVKGSDTSWVSGPTAIEVWKLATELGASICFHFMRWNRDACLHALQEMCTRFADTTVVIDHLSNLSAENGQPDFGVDGPLEFLARCPRVFQKFTMINIGKLAGLGLPSAPVVRRVVQSYGAHRVMWGSDVAQSDGTYGELVRLGEAAAGSLDTSERARVLGGTARVVYSRRNLR